MGQSKSPWKENNSPPQQPVMPATSANPWAQSGGGELLHYTFVVVNVVV